MPILISKSWSNITPESAEDGEIADSCMLWDNVECSFRELVEYMREHREPSCSPADGSTYDSVLCGRIGLSKVGSGNLRFTDSTGGR